MTVALAASVLFTAGIVAAGWSYLAREQQRRVVQVDLALHEAELRRDDAQQARDDLSRWMTARDAAHAVARLVADARDAATRDRVTTLLQQVEQAAQAARMITSCSTSWWTFARPRPIDRDGSTTDAAYADAFREAGIDVDSLAPAEAGARIKARPASVSLALAAALDHWALRRRKSRPKPENAWMQLVAAARASDLDPGRDRLRELWAHPDLKSQLEPLRNMAHEAGPEAWPVQSLLLLARALADAGDQDAAVQVLRRSQGTHPGDVELNYLLGFILEGAHPPQTEEAIRFYSVARALRPETAHGLAHALRYLGRGDEAVAVYQDMVRLRPDDGCLRACYASLLKERGMGNVAAHEFERAIADLESLNRLKPDRPDFLEHLAYALSQQGKHDEAIAEFRTALRLKPDFAEAHSNLGNVLYDQGKLGEAIAEFHNALRLKADSHNAHSGLGAALGRQGKLAEAIAEFREAIRLKPDFSDAHSDLGTALRLQGKLAEAIKEFREAIRLKPDCSHAHSGLGATLCDQGSIDEAIAEDREAIRLKPDSPEAHSNLGAALWRQRKLAEAIVECREAIRLKPSFAEAHVSHGTALGDQGKLNEAIVEFSEAIHLKPNLANAHYNLGNDLFYQGCPRPLPSIVKRFTSIPTIPKATATWD